MGELEQWHNRNIQEWLVMPKRIVSLEQELKVNASMLAKQCDLARDAETKSASLEQENERLQARCQHYYSSSDRWDDNYHALQDEVLDLIPQEHRQHSSGAIESLKRYIAALEEET